MNSNDESSLGPRKSLRTRQKRSLGDDFIDPTSVRLAEIQRKSSVTKKKKDSVTVSSTSPTESTSEACAPEKKVVSQSPIPSQILDEVPTTSSSSLVLRQIAEKVTETFAKQMKNEVKNVKIENNQDIHESMKSRVSDLQLGKDEKLRNERLHCEESEKKSATIPSDENPKGKSKPIVYRRKPIIYKRPETTLTFERSSGFWPRKPPIGQRPIVDANYQQDLEKDRRLDEEAAAKVAAIRAANAQKILQKRSMGKISTGGQAAAQNEEIFKYVSSTSNPSLLHKRNYLQGVPLLETSSRNAPFVQVSERTIAVSPRPSPLCLRISAKPIRLNVTPSAQNYVQLAPKLPVKVIMPTKLPAAGPSQIKQNDELKEPKKELVDPLEAQMTLKEPKAEPMEEPIEMKPLSFEESKNTVANKNATVIKNLSRLTHNGDTLSSIRQVPILTHSVRINKNESPSNPCTPTRSTLKEDPQRDSPSTTGTTVKKVVVIRSPDGELRPKRRLLILRPKAKESPPQRPINTLMITPTPVPNYCPFPVARPLSELEKFQRERAKTVASSLPKNVMTATIVRNGNNEADSQYILASEKRVNLHPHQPQIIISNDDLVKQESATLKEENAENVKEEPTDDNLANDINDTTSGILSAEVCTANIPESIAMNTGIVVPRLSREYRKRKNVEERHTRQDCTSDLKTMSPPKIFLGAEEPMKDNDDELYQYRRFNVEKIDQFSSSDMQPFGKRPPSFVDSVDEFSSATGYSDLLLSEIDSVENSKIAQQDKKLLLQKRYESKQDINMERIRQTEALAQKIRVNQFKILKYMQSDEFKTSLTPSRDITDFEKIFMSPNVLAQVPAFCESLSHSQPELSDNLHRIHQMKYMEKFCTLNSYPLKHYRQRDLNMKVSGPVKILEMGETASDGTIQTPTSTKTKLIKVVWNGLLAHVPEEVICHLCDDVMRLCMRKSNYRGELREYPAYRCLRKGCQTFRSIKKQIDSSLKAGDKSLQLIKVEAQEQSEYKSNGNCMTAPKMELVEETHGVSSNMPHQTDFVKHSDFLDKGKIELNKEVRTVVRFEEKPKNLSGENHCENTTTGITNGDETEDDDEELFAGETVSFEFISGKCNDDNSNNDENEDDRFSYHDDSSEFDPSGSNTPEQYIEESNRSITGDSQRTESLPIASTSDSVKRLEELLSDDIKKEECDSYEEKKPEKFLF